MEIVSRSLELNSNHVTDPLPTANLAVGIKTVVLRRCGRERERVRKGEIRRAELVAGGGDGKEGRQHIVWNSRPMC